MFLLTFAAIALVAMLARRSRSGAGHGDAVIARQLDSRVILAAVFVTTFLVLWCSWGEWNPLPVVHDEMAYVLQSRIFASGHWALPPQAMPAFWEQPHVLVQPAVAAKYFPGHALVLTLGALVGWPALMPLVLQSIAAVLVFILARKLANGGVALLTWIIWLTSPIVVHFGPTYFSEGTTTVCWLAGWYALLEWRETRRARWLVAVAVCTAWCFVTRPLTGVAYAIPIAVLVLRDVIAERRWRDLGVSLAAGAAVLAIIPLWSALTTGDWRQTPLLLYTRLYMPYDVPGFGLITTRPAMPLSPQLTYLNELYSRWHVNHFPATLPTTLLARGERFAESVWGGATGPLMLCAGVGLFVVSSAAGFALVTGLVLLLLYLSFATPPQWTLYYYESVPALAYLTAIGLAWIAAKAADGLGRSLSDADWRSPRWTSALAAGAIAICVPSADSFLKVRRAHQDIRAPLVAFESMRQAIPGGKAVLFVHYEPLHDPNVSFVQNFADPADERVWSVFDRGPDENARLLSTVPERQAYIFVEGRGATFRYDPALLRHAVSAARGAPH